MTFNKEKAFFLIIILAVSVGTLALSQSFAQEYTKQFLERQDAMNQQKSLFSSQAMFGDKNRPEGFERMMSQRDPGVGHEQHQLAVIIPLSEKLYTGTLYYSASEPVQLISLKGPLEAGDEKGKMVWTADGQTYYDMTQVNESTSKGTWNFVGNALAVHTFKDTPFVVDYKVNYEEVEDSESMPLNSVEDVKILANFAFDKENVTIESFKVYKQLSGYKKESPIVNLQGVVGIDKSILYRAADTHFNKGSGPYGRDHQYSEFTLTIDLQSGDFPIRKMVYRECDITDYNIDTLYDNDYSYNRASAFVLVDNFEITCAGMQPYHYNYQKYIDEYGVDWVKRMKDVEMSPKTFQDYGAD